MQTHTSVCFSLGRLFWPGCDCIISDSCLRGFEDGKDRQEYKLIRNVDVSSFSVKDVFLRRMMMAAQLERRRHGMDVAARGGELYAVAPGDEVRGNPQIPLALGACM